MKQCKRLVYVSGLCLLFSVMAGCGEQEAQEGTAQTDPAHFYEEVRDDILIDADVIWPEGDYIPRVYEAEPIIITKEDINKFIEFCDDGVARVTMDKRVGTANAYYVETDKGGEVICNTFTNVEEPGSAFSYCLDEDMPYSDVVTGYGGLQKSSYVEEDNTFLYDQPKDFAFATAKEAEAIVREALKAINLDHLILERTLYLDHEVMQRYQQENLEDITELHEKMEAPYAVKDWTEADDCYQFMFSYDVDGIPTIVSDRVTPTFTITPAGATFRYTEKGIIRASVGDFWKLAETVEEPEKIISATEAMETVKEKLESVYSGQVREVQEIALRYAPMQDKNRWLLSPVWEVLVCEKDVPLIYAGITSDEYSYILVDALTGEEL